MLSGSSRSVVVAFAPRCHVHPELGLLMLSAHTKKTSPLIECGRLVYMWTNINSWSQVKQNPLKKIQARFCFYSN